MATAERSGWIRRFEAHLSRHASPRTHFALIAAITGAAGFLASAALLRLGLGAMWLRYSLAVAIAYLAFLALLGVWLALARSQFLRMDIIPEDPPPVPGAAGRESKKAEGPFSTVGRIAEALGEASDVFFIIFMVLAVVTLVVLGAALVIASAPALLAEVLLDGLLSAGLYRRMRGIESVHWLETVFRRTWPAFLGVFLAFLAAGLLIHSVDPQALSVVDFLKHLGRPRR